MVSRMCVSPSAKRCFTNGFSMILHTFPAFPLKISLNYAGFIRYFATCFPPSQNTPFSNVFHGFPDVRFPLSKTLYPQWFFNDFPHLFCVFPQNGMGFLRFYKVFCNMFPVFAKHNVSQRFFMIFRWCASPSAEPCFPNGFPPISSTFFTFCLKISLNFTGFIRCFAICFPSSPNTQFSNVFHGFPDVRFPLFPRPFHKHLGTYSFGVTTVTDSWDLHIFQILINF